ncbi:serine--tRNA ligase [Gracilimonas sediminicola]|uniref:Serine--tRNA ligase n=1 Tax=Gracilimonas sediminicola TaxID=2952158 RepID=A0A9X2L4M9_9BACT|nr:serine--tRNA ligase [Gracilimonas sediminicola]MCP9292232.1 serine--tRNA ligase [Gracilimonas sediminicola]
MLDINFIKENRELVEKAIINKGEKDTSVVEKVLSVDEDWRSKVHEGDLLRSESNTKAKEIGKLMGQGKKEEAQEIIKKTSQMKERIKEIEEEVKELREKRDDMLLRIPNIPHPSVPVGATEDDNETFKTWGQPNENDWRKPHWELTERHGWVDFERGVKVTGAGFPFYVGGVAQLQRALINYFINEAGKAGYTELQAPYFVNEDSARGTGQIPDKEDMMYVIPRDEFFTIPTAEVPVTNFHRDEIIELKELPLKYVCHTPCWRREAGSYGKDVRGLNRLHQFDKVELVKIVNPEDSYDELESLREHAEKLLEALELPYRTLLMCTGDMGFTQSKKYDIEVWSLGQQRWLEVSSCSNFESFQARRMQLRYRKDEKEIETLHTLNGSGLALPRVVSAILEAYQEENGKVRVPEVLKPFIGRDYL